MLKYFLAFPKKTQLNFVFLIICVVQFHTVVFGQVSINEKIEINPSTFISDSPTFYNNHSFIYTMTWTPSSTSRANIRIIVCGDTINSGWSTSGSATITFSGNTHFYLFQPQRYFYKPGHGYGWWDSSIPDLFLEVYIDDINLNHPQEIWGSGNGLFGIFQFRINDLYCENGTIEINPSSSSECNQPNWYYNDEVNIQIKEGSAYFTFYDTLSGLDLGTMTQIPFNDIPNIILKRNENAPPLFTPQIISLEADINGVVDTTWTIFYPNNVVIRVPDYPDTLTTGHMGDINIDMYDYCDTIPQALKIIIDIMAGGEYGNLIDPVTGERVKHITGLDHYYGNATVSYIADEETPVYPDSVKIRISTTDPGVPYKDITIYINPSPLLVIIDPYEVSPGDTANIIIKKRNPDGSYVDFSPDKTFEMALTEDCVDGNILVDDSLGVYFDAAQQPMYFVAADSIENDTGYVRLRVGTNLDSTFKFSDYNISKKKRNLSFEKKLIAPDKYLTRKELETGFKNLIDEKRKVYKKNMLDNKLEITSETSCFTGNYLYEYDYWMGTIPVTVPKELNILLGETKYYQAQYKDPLTNELVIKEVPVDNNGIPHLQIGGLPMDVWHSNPVSVVDEGENYGKRMGVYWETEKPMANGENLPAGLIRLVGRYCDPDSIYIVKLKASRNDDIGSAQIKIIKPDLLGNSNFASDWNNGIDIENNEYSIDSVCIDLGGNYGFPPQYIKAQYSIEAAYDPVLDKVCPSYRYEPWTTQFEVEKTFKNGHFWVTSTSMGDGDPVPNHHNVRFMTYEITPRSVWYFIEQYTNIVQNPAPYGGKTLFGYKRSSDNKLIFTNYSDPKTEYEAIRTEIYQNLGLDPETENLGANESARLEFISKMRLDYEGGLNSIEAQTRVASSYGPVQLLYGTATDRGYLQGPNNKPEDLNVMNVFWPLAMNHLKYLLTLKSGSNNNNWPDGFEATLKNIYRAWNKRSGYPDEVVRNIPKFMPLKSEGE